MKDATTFNVESQQKGSDIVDNFQQYLLFNVGNEIYGFNVKCIKEVIEFSEVFEIPSTPDYIQGVINLRGDVVPVIDLASLFYHEVSSITKKSCIIILEINEGGEVKSIGGLIDSIIAVSDFYEDDISDTPHFGSKIKSDYIHKVGKVDNDFAILLNEKEVFNIDELSNFEI